MTSYLLSVAQNLSDVIASWHSWISSRKIKVFPGTIFFSGKRKRIAIIILSTVRSPAKISIADGICLKLISSSSSKFSSANRSMIYVFPVCLAPWTTRHFLSFVSSQFLINVVAFLFSIIHLKLIEFITINVYYQHFRTIKCFTYQHFRKLYHSFWASTRRRCIHIIIKNSSFHVLPHFMSHFSIYSHIL